MLGKKATDVGKQIAGIIIGTALYAFGIYYFIIPNELMEGGVTGISLILHYAAQISPSLTNLALNVPLFLIGLKVFGSRSMFYTAFGIASLSFFFWVYEQMINQGWITPFASRQDYFLVTLYAGVSIGGGLGIVFRSGGTTGGVDIIARLANKWKGWSMGQVILFMDTLVIGCALFYLPKEKILYTLVSVFVGSKIIDFITEGAYTARAFTIISDHGDEIAKKINVEMDRGVTLFPAHGAYSRQQKNVVYCVVARHEVSRLKAIVHQLDPAAFIIIGSVHDVLGEGFRDKS
ncbi:YitT family protein [Gorillibacterium massiliense]|uniref:YitT family protein n=1 Tax=Gorillibacterium massiliense TaxID=1280390 RepID=UPI0004B9844E|nr:YitT family protein [Gorillibacterium massiliense]